MSGWVREADRQAELADANLEKLAKEWMEKERWPEYGHASYGLSTQVSPRQRLTHGLLVDFVKHLLREGIL
jgi:hypothetical protein